MRGLDSKRALWTQKVTKKCGSLSVNLLRLWWLYALDPAHRRFAHGVRVMAMFWVEGVRPPQAMERPTPWGMTKTKINNFCTVASWIVRRSQEMSPKIRAYLVPLPKTMVQSTKRLPNYTANPFGEEKKKTRHLLGRILTTHRLGNRNRGADKYHTTPTPIAYLASKAVFVFYYLNLGR